MLWATDEVLRKKLFEKTLAKKECLSVSKDMKGKLNFDALGLQEFLSSIQENLIQEKKDGLTPLFHPRLKISSRQLQDILNSFQAAYKKSSLDKLQFNYQKVWALNTVDGLPDLLHCPEDGIAIKTHHGYNLQFAAMIQIASEKELGKIFITIVPNKNKWWIGQWHTWQWTHTGKDYLTWVELGQTDLKNNLKESSYIKFEIAEKLLEGGKNLIFLDRETILKAKDSLFKNADWQKIVLSPIEKSQKIIRAFSILAKDGSGLGVSYYLDPNLSINAMQKTCHEALAIYKNQKWFTALDGLMCQFIRQGDPPDREGPLGSIYLSNK